MRTLDHPPVSRLPDFRNIAEQVEVEQLVSIRPVEPLDVGILVRLSGLDVLDRHPVGLGPGYELSPEKLRAVIDPKDARQAAIQSQTFKDPDQAFAGY